MIRREGGLFLCMLTATPDTAGMGHKARPPSQVGGTEACRLCWPVRALCSYSNTQRDPLTTSVTGRSGRAHGRETLGTFESNDDTTKTKKKRENERTGQEKQHSLLQRACRGATDTQKQLNNFFVHLPLCDSMVLLG